MQDVRDASDAALYQPGVEIALWPMKSPAQICPGARIAWTPGTIAFSDSSNSMRSFRGGRSFNATIDQRFFHVVLHSRAARVGCGGSEIPFCFDITYGAFANAGLPLVSSTPPMWSRCAWVKITFVISSGVMPSDFKFLRSPVAGACPSPPVSTSTLCCRALITRPV